MIDAAHEGWLGKKNFWKAAVWEVLETRYLTEQLHSFLYPIASPSEQKSTEEPAVPRALPASSSSGFQETLNEAPPKEDSGCVNFPKSAPVEEDPVIVVDEGADSAQGREEQTAEDIESAMLRWVEMVECVVMLESIN